MNFRKPAKLIPVIILMMLSFCFSNVSYDVLADGTSSKSAIEISPEENEKITYCIGEIMTVVVKIILDLNNRCCIPKNGKDEFGQFISKFLLASMNIHVDYVNLESYDIFVKRWKSSSYYRKNLVLHVKKL